MWREIGDFATTVIVDEARKCWFLTVMVMRRVIPSLLHRAAPVIEILSF